MNKILRFAAAVTSFFFFSGAANAFTVYACTNGVYTVTTVEMAPTANGYQTVSSTVTVPGPCSGEWAYVEAISIRPDGGLVFEETGPSGAGPIRILSAKSTVVRAIQSGWQRMGTKAAPKARIRILAEDEARRVRAAHQATPQIRIGIPVRLLAR